MKLYTYKTLNERPKRQTIEEASANLERIIYYYEDQILNARPRTASLEEIFSADQSDITVYSHEILPSENRPRRGLITDIIPWPLRMVMSYRALHPEQSLWFNIRTVPNLQSLNVLQNDTSFQAESWVHVEDRGDGVSAEYVLTADRSFWVNVDIIDNEIPSGKEVLYELYDRLSAGYLYDTFGPSGQNRNICDFLYVFYRTGELFARAWNKPGATIRWDFGEGNVVSNNGVPAQALGSDPVVTCSAEDDFSGINNIRVNMRTFKGAPPRLNTSSVTTQSFSFNVFATSGFAGKFPVIDTSNMTNTEALARLCVYFTSIPSLDFSSVDTNCLDMFAYMFGVTKLAPLYLPNATGLLGTFRGMPITELPVIIGGTNITSIASMLNQCGRLPNIINDEDLDWLSPTNDIVANNVLSLSNVTTINSPKIFSDNIVDMQTSFSNSNIVDVDISDLSGLTNINAGWLNPFSYCHDISQKTIDLFLQKLYESRIAHKQNATQPFFGIYLGTAKTLPNGIYQDSPEPSTGMEYMYKLKENPDNEDINDYYFVLPEKEYVEEDRYSKIGITLSGDNTFTIRIGISFAKLNEIIIIDWGDGTEESIDYNSEYIFEKNINGDVVVTFNADITHQYPSSGDYVITVKKGAALALAGGNGLYGIVSNRAKIKTVELGYDISQLSTITINGFRAMPNLEEIRSTHPVLVLGWLRDAFNGATSLKHIDPLYCFMNDNNDALRAFQNTGNIESVKLIGMHKTFSIANNKLNGEALNELFDGLADITNGTPATVTVTNNPGINDAEYDRTIATNKGWTVVD